VVFRIAWHGARMVAMTSRKMDAPVVTTHVRSANVLRENTDSRRCLDSIEKNRLNSENTTTPMVRATASV
jgi:hypothetical protein